MSSNLSPPLPLLKNNRKLLTTKRATTKRAKTTVATTSGTTPNDNADNVTMPPKPKLASRKPTAKKTEGETKDNVICGAPPAAKPPMISSWSPIMPAACTTALTWQSASTAR